MILKLTKSKIFTTHPANRFADTYKVTPDIFHDLWKRHKLLDYSIPELCEVYYIKVGKPIKRRRMDDWMFMGEIYLRSLEKMKLGVEAVNSEIFGDLEQRLLNILFKHLKSGDTANLRTLA